MTLTAFYKKKGKVQIIIKAVSSNSGQAVAPSPDECDLFMKCIVPALFNLFPREEVRPLVWVLHPKDNDPNRTLFLSQYGLVIMLEISTGGKKKAAGIFEITIMMPTEMNTYPQISWPMGGKDCSIRVHQFLPRLFRVKGSREMVENGGVVNHVNGESFLSMSAFLYYSITVANHLNVSQETMVTIVSKTWNHSKMQVIIMMPLVEDTKHKQC